MIKFVSRPDEAPKLPGIRAIIFDLDGTLIDSLDDITDALNAGLQRLGEPGADRERVRTWIGDGLANLCRRALQNDDNRLVDQLQRHVRDAYMQHCADKTLPYPNILETLELLQQKGIPACVLSNKPHDLTVAIVAQLGMNQFFRRVRGCMDEEHRKPSPVAALELLEVMGHAAAETVMIGDGPADILCARNAGMKSAAVTWGFRDRPELKKIAPDFFLDDQRKILDLIG